MAGSKKDPVMINYRPAGLGPVGGGLGRQGAPGGRQLGPQYNNDDDDMNMNTGCGCVTATTA